MFNLDRKDLFINNTSALVNALGNISILGQKVLIERLAGI